MGLIQKNIFKIATVSFLILSVVFGSILVRQQQDIRNRASGGCANGSHCEISCDSSHPNRDATECKCWGDPAHNNAGSAQDGQCVQDGGAVVPTSVPGSGMACGVLPNNSLSYDTVSRCNYRCNNGTQELIQGSCLPAGTAPQSAPSGYFLVNGTSGQVVANPGNWTSNGTTASANTSSSSLFSGVQNSWTCQVCTCTSLTNGECRDNCTNMPCSQATVPACGQVDACPPGQPSSQCGAAAENRIMGTNCPNPTSPPSSPTPARTNTPTTTPRPSNTPTTTPRPSNTPTPTPTPSPMPTPQPRSCGSIDCSNTSNPCQNGLVCITANDSRSYCSKPEYIQACKDNANGNTCCNAPASTPTPTPQPRACGAIDCSNTNNPCQDGLVCISANNSKNYCVMPDYVQACKDNPTNSNCCSAQSSTPTPIRSNSPTPTRIILPVSGIDLPIKGLGIVGGIVTLLGILLIL